MPSAFEVLEAPRMSRIAAQPFVHIKVRGPYSPWRRVLALDNVAEALEREESDRLTAPTGIYMDLPRPSRGDHGWVALFGYGVDARAPTPHAPAMRRADLPETRAASLRYRGDLLSFPRALQALLDWVEEQGHDVGGPLVQRFHLSDPMTGMEDREMLLPLEPFDLMPA